MIYLMRPLYHHQLHTQLQPLNDRLPILAREFPYPLIFDQTFHVIDSGSSKR